MSRIRFGLLDMPAFSRDLRFAIRALLKEPGDVIQMTDPNRIHPAPFRAPD
jgi:hypothetical protein